MDHFFRLNLLTLGICTLYILVLTLLLVLDVSVIV